VANREGRVVWKRKGEGGGKKLECDLAQKKPAGVRASTNDRTGDRRMRDQL